MYFSCFNAFIVNLCIILTIFISSTLRANEIQSFDDKLSHADSIRSSHPKQFLILLDELNQQRNSLSIEQHHHLNYLNFYLLMYQGDFDKSISSAQALLHSTANSLLKFRVKLGLVNISAVNQNWSKGLSYLSSILHELPQIEDKQSYHGALQIIGMFYNQLGQYNLSLSYTKKVESESPRGRDQCMAKWLIIESSFRLKRLTPTDPIINQTISLCRINNEYITISYINSYVAEMYLNNQQADKALVLLNETLQDTLNTKYPRIIAITYALLAQAHWLNNDVFSTKQFALKALEYETKEDTVQAKTLSYKLLFEVEKSQKNYELALFYHQKYTAADKVNYNETQKKYLAFQIAEHQAIEQQNEIDLLNKENALLTSEKALLTAEKAMTRSNIQNNRLVITILILAISVLTFWGYHLLKAHKRIKELAEYDSLTGIFNRGHFTHIADTTLEYCKSASQNLSLIMFDLDQFKDVNDNYGHACGDWVLKKAAEACKQLGRKNDIFARIGGEEFCILLSSCDMQAAEQRAEACRKAISEINTSSTGFDFTITASFGVTDTKTSGYDLGKLLADADNAAYVSKDAGRNKVTLFKPKTIEKEAVKLDNSLNAF
ncbi:GGDEF domain-containing protein [Colwellia sp. E150_009]